MSTLDLFVPLVKVDADRRLVQGVVTAETPDRAGEICDYVSTKPYFEAWSETARAASQGKSLGAVRAMHNRIAAGKLTDIEFDDAAKTIAVSAKIVDDDEWAKVCEGVYTGFSQGGRYVKKWPDTETGLIRYTADPIEISLVDVPCLPDATFELLRGGVAEKRAFLPRQDTVSSPSPVAEAKTENAPEPRNANNPNFTAHEDRLAAIAETLTRSAETIAESRSESVELRKSLAELPALVEKLAARVAALEAQPTSIRAVRFGASKTQDALGESGAGSVEDALKRLTALPPAERAHALMKLALANPRPRI